jgi:hypothetical protein
MPIVGTPATSRPLRLVIPIMALLYVGNDPKIERQL